MKLNPKIGAGGCKKLIAAYQVLKGADRRVIRSSIQNQTSSIVAHNCQLCRLIKSLVKLTWLDITTISIAAKDQEEASQPWAHTIAAPEQGCLLLAHPLMFVNSQVYFHQVITASHLFQGADLQPCSSCCFNNYCVHQVNSVADEISEFEPYLQAVILITSHSDQGTAGVILNKPLEHLIGKIVYLKCLAKGLANT